MTETSLFGQSTYALATGDRVRVAHGVFGRLGRVRSLSPGHVLIDYDDGGRQLVDLTRRRMWLLR